MRSKLILIVLIATGISSCSSYIRVNRLNPSANYDIDFAQCENEAMVRVPMPPPRRSNSYTTNCTRSGSDLTCNTSENSNEIPGAVQLEVSNNRYTYRENCLSTKGWRIETNIQASDNKQLTQDQKNNIIIGCRYETNKNMPSEKYGLEINNSAYRACINREEGKAISRLR